MRHRQLSEMIRCARVRLSFLSGSNLSGPIYMGCAGKVFDVTGGASFYGPGGAYGGFAGTDASRGLAKMDLKPSSFAVDDLGPAEKNTLKEVSSRSSSSSSQHVQRRTEREGRAAAAADVVVAVVRSQHCGRRCALLDPQLNRFSARESAANRHGALRSLIPHARRMRADHAINCSATLLRWASIHFRDSIPNRRGSLLAVAHFIPSIALCNFFSPSSVSFSLCQWCDKFESKYPIVGKIVDFSQANSGPKPADGVYTQSSL